jgi:hypothetical protein
MNNEPFDVMPIISKIRENANWERFNSLRLRLQQEKIRHLDYGFPSGENLPKLNLSHFKKKLGGFRRPLAYLFYGIYNFCIPFVHLLWRYFGYLDIKTRREEYNLEFIDHILTELELLHQASHEAKK